MKARQPVTVMTALPRMPPLARDCMACGVWSKAKTSSDDGAQHALVDEGGDLAELVTAGAHEEELVAHAELLRLACGSCC